MDVLDLLKQQQAFNRLEFAQKLETLDKVEAAQNQGYKFVGLNADTGSPVFAQEGDEPINAGVVITSGAIKPGQDVLVRKADTFVTVDQMPAPKKAVESITVDAQVEPFWLLGFQDKLFISYDPELKELQEVQQYPDYLENGEGKSIFPKDPAYPKFTKCISYYRLDDKYFLLGNGNTFSTDPQKNWMPVVFSDDKGQSWDFCEETAKAAPGSIYLQIAGGNNILMVSTYNQGVLISEDYGQSWELIPLPWRGDLPEDRRLEFYDGIFYVVDLNLPFGLFPNDPTQFTIHFSEDGRNWQQKVIVVPDGVSPNNSFYSWIYVASQRFITLVPWLIRAFHINSDLEFDDLFRDTLIDDGTVPYKPATTQPTEEQFYDVYEPICGSTEIDEVLQALTFNRWYAIPPAANVKPPNRGMARKWDGNGWQQIPHVIYEEATQKFGTAVIGIITTPVYSPAAERWLIWGRYFPEVLFYQGQEHGGVRFSSSADGSEWDEPFYPDAFKELDATGLNSSLFLEAIA